MFIKSIVNYFLNGLRDSVPKQEQAAFPINDLDAELLGCVLWFLSAEDLARVSRVSTIWYKLATLPSQWRAFDPQRLYPGRLKIIDAPVWKTHVDLAALDLSVEDEPPLDNRILIPLFKKLLAPGVIEGDKGLTILTIPKGLIYSILKRVAQSPKQEHATQFRDIGPEVAAVLETISVDKTYRVVITNNVLQNSRNKSVQDQQKFVNELGCEMPEALPVSTLAILTYISSQEPSPTRLYSDSPWTYIRCIEQVYIEELQRLFQLVVGGFAPRGLAVDDFGNDDREFIGVVGFRKLC